jgi:hypothetical protein
MDVREIGWAVIDWIDLTLDMELWRALVNTEMNLRVLIYVGIFRGLSSMELVRYYNLKKNPRSESASELYRPGERRLSAK